MGVGISRSLWGGEKGRGVGEREGGRETCILVSNSFLARARASSFFCCAFISLFSESCPWTRRSDSIFRRSSSHESCEVDRERQRQRERETERDRDRDRERRRWGGWGTERREGDLDDFMFLDPLLKDPSRGAAIFVDLVQLAQQLSKVSKLLWRRIAAWLWDEAVVLRFGIVAGRLVQVAGRGRGGCRSWVEIVRLGREVLPWALQVQGGLQWGGGWRRESGGRDISNVLCRRGFIRTARIACGWPRGRWLSVCGRGWRFRCFCLWGRLGRRGGRRERQPIRAQNGIDLVLDQDCQLVGGDRQIQLLLHFGRHHLARGGREPWVGRREREGREGYLIVVMLDVEEELHVLDHTVGCLSFAQPQLDCDDPAFWDRTDPHLDGARVGRAVGGLREEERRREGRWLGAFLLGVRPRKGLTIAAAVRDERRDGRLVRGGGGLRMRIVGRRREDRCGMARRSDRFGWENVRAPVTICLRPFMGSIG
jgi:hypothetical protein